MSSPSDCSTPFIDRTNLLAVPRSLAQIDLNLLVALDVLLAERHVTRAARRMGITQSAMSQTLQRLRDVLGDPILVRRGTAMAPSPRAEALAGPLHAALRGLERVVLEPPAFEPARSDRSFRLATFDVYGVSVLPRLQARVHEQAPHAVLDVVPVVMERVHEQLRQGELDVALLRPRESPADIAGEPAIEEQLVSMVRQGHPLLRARITAAAFVRWPHATFRIADGGPTVLDARLDELGLSRRVPLRLPYFLAAPALACETDLVITLPRSAARAFERSWPVVVFTPPVPPVRYTVHMIWSRHLDADPGHRWLRAQVLAAVHAVQAECAG